ncbi:hypothetical protein ACFWVB_02520 [Streptomyces microflavus]|uniref:hypothetical protein n=1 Tax=Streptomyces microflavus TaxID=1919 RepID=UPI00365E9936
MDESAEQPRIPGVKYRPVKRFREETTEIDGVASTRTVGYDAWEPVPPREWDDLILNGATAVAVGFTAIAVAGGTASIGGLLSPLVPGVVAYGMGSVFAIAWMNCLAFEWMNRTRPSRARPAMVAGWFFLLLSMGAVVAYGHTKDALWAGAFGACVDLIAKGSWWLLLREYAVPLDAGVAHWLQDQEQKLAGRALLGKRMRRLNRQAAYQQAMGGTEFRAAGAILASADASRRGPSQPSVREAAPVAVAEPAPAAPVAPQPAPPAAPTVAASAAPLEKSVPSVPPADEQQAPVPPVDPAAPPVPPVEPVTPEPTPAANPQVTAIDRPSIGAICRDAIGANPKVTDDDLLTAVLKAGHPNRRTLADTVRRSAQRIDPNRKAS